MSDYNPSSELGPEQKFSDSEAVSVLNESIPNGLRLMNANCINASNADASLTISYKLDERFINGAGYICGGYVANALDQSMAYAMTFITGDPAPTLEIKVSFVAAARPGRLIAIGKVLKAGKNIGFVEGVLHDDSGKLIATASATLQRTSMDRLMGHSK